MYGKNHEGVDGFMKRKFIEAINIFNSLIIHLSSGPHISNG